MDSRENSILVAVDGSEQSLETVRYVARMVTAKRARITLLHVAEQVPEGFSELGTDLELQVRSAGIETWVSQRNEMIQDFLERARQFFADYGYAPNSVRSVVHKMQASVARDISTEAMMGYDALVVGRSGASEVRDVIMGSTAYKLVTHLSRVPVWVVGGQPDPARILIAMDSSDGAMRAMEYIADFFGEIHPELLLFHVTRGFNSSSPDQEQMASSEVHEDSLTRWEEVFESARREMEGLFQTCLDKLAQKGADRNRIRTKIVPGVYSRAAAIFGEAQEGGYGTIVVGRRGLSRVEEFMMGRVSNKVLQLAREMAVWLVT